MARGGVGFSAAGDQAEDGVAGEVGGGGGGGVEGGGGEVQVDLLEGGAVVEDGASEFVHVSHRYGVPPPVLFVAAGVGYSFDGAARRSSFGSGVE